MSRAGSGCLWVAPSPFPFFFNHLLFRSISLWTFLFPFFQFPISPKGLPSIFPFKSPFTSFFSWSDFVVRLQFEPFSWIRFPWPPPRPLGPEARLSRSLAPSLRRASISSGQINLMPIPTFKLDALSTRRFVPSISFYQFFFFRFKVFVFILFQLGGGDCMSSR